MGKKWVGGYACRIDKWGALPRVANEPIGEGTLEVVRIHRPTYEKQRVAERLRWTLVSNLVLLKAAFGSMRRADAVLFTGSPPLMLHFIAPLNLIMRREAHLPDQRLSSGVSYRRARAGWISGQRPAPPHPVLAPSDRYV